MTDTPLDGKNLIALTLSDVDIFLLQNEAQDGDKDKLFTVSEIREQLKATAAKMQKTLKELDFDLDEPIPTIHQTNYKRIYGEKNN